MNTLIKPPCCNGTVEDKRIDQRLADLTAKTESAIKEKVVALAILTPNTPGEIDTWYSGTSVAELKDKYLINYFCTCRNEAEDDPDLLESLSERKMYTYTFAIDTPAEVISFFKNKPIYKMMHEAGYDYELASSYVKQYATLAAQYLYNDYCD